jgi:uncharacterized membrane protein
MSAKHSRRRKKRMAKADQFEGRSWLNILAAVVLFAGAIFPVSGLLFPSVSAPDWPILEHVFGTLTGILVWYVAVIIVTLVIASAGRTQERLARIEHELGLDRPPETGTSQCCEQHGGQISSRDAQIATPDETSP